MKTISHFNMNEKIYDYFKERFKLMPSFLQIKITKKDIVEKFFSKSHLIFVNKTVIDGQIIETERLVEYDSNGILVYIKNGVDIFILTNPDRLNVAEFTLHNLIKLNK